MTNYYQTHDETLAEASARFDVSKCPISPWRAAFDKYSIEGLKPYQKGRKPKVKHDKKKLRHLVNKNELDQLREELAKEIVSTMRQSKVSFIYSKQSVSMDFHLVKILKNLGKFLRSTSIGLTINAFQEKQRA